MIPPPPPPPVPPPLFFSSPLVLSLLIAEPAVAPAATAAQALHLSYAHACLCAYTLIQPHTDADRLIDSVSCVCVWVDQDVPVSLAGLRMFFLSPSVHPSLSSVFCLCIELPPISFALHLFTTISVSLCLCLPACLSVSLLSCHDCGFRALLGLHPVIHPQKILNV